MSFSNGTTRYLQKEFSVSWLETVDQSFSCIVQFDAFFFFVLCDLLSLLGLCLTPGGPFTCFLFDFEEGINVPFKQMGRTFREIPNFNQSNNAISKLARFHDVNGKPGAYQNALFVNVFAGSFQEILHTRST